MYGKSLQVHVIILTVIDKKKIMYLHHSQKMIFFYNQANTCIHILNLVINTCTFGWTVKNWQKKIIRNCTKILKKY